MVYSSESGFFCWENLFTVDLNRVSCPPVPIKWNLLFKKSLFSAPRVVSEFCEARPFFWLLIGRQPLLLSPGSCFSGWWEVLNVTEINSLCRCWSLDRTSPIEWKTRWPSIRAQPPLWLMQQSSCCPTWGPGSSRFLSLAGCTLGCQGRVNKDPECECLA